MRLASFAIFDTCWRRAVVCPTDVLRCVADETGPHFVWRRRASAWVAGKLLREPKIDNIYSLLKDLFQLDADPTAELLQERRLARADARGLELVTAFRQRGYAISFVAHPTHLPHEFLQSVLTGLGFFQPGDTILGAVADIKTHLHPEYWVHHGPNRIRDGTEVEALGALVQRFQAYPATPAEQRLAHLAPRVAGYARLTRLRSPHYLRNSDPARLWNIGASVIGPWMHAYVRWLHLQANLNGVTQLWFTSPRSALAYQFWQQLYPQGSIAAHYIADDQAVPATQARLHNGDAIGIAIGTEYLGQFRVSPRIPVFSYAMEASPETHSFLPPCGCPRCTMRAALNLPLTQYAGLLAQVNEAGAESLRAGTWAYIATVQAQAQLGYTVPALYPSQIELLLRSFLRHPTKDERQALATLPASNA